MLTRLKQSWLVWSLLLGLVLVNGLLAVPAVAHAEHHAQHQAGTHATGLCAWQCAAGQSIDTSWVHPEFTLYLLERAVPGFFNKVHEAILLCPFLRGPPVSLT